VLLLRAPPYIMHSYIPALASFDSLRPGSRWPDKHAGMTLLYAQRNVSDWLGGMATSAGHRIAYDACARLKEDSERRLLLRKKVGEGVLG